MGCFAYIFLDFIIAQCFHCYYPLSIVDCCKLLAYSLAKVPVPLRHHSKRFTNWLDGQLMDLHVGRRLDAIRDCIGYILSTQHGEVWQNLPDFFINDFRVDGSGANALRVEKYLN